MLFLVVSSFLDTIVFTLGFVCILALLFIFFYLFVRPALREKALRDFPPNIGFQHVIVIPIHETLERVTIGKLHATINLRIKGFHEKHLALKIRKEVSMEEYDIILEPSGKNFVKMPHMREFERLKSRESFTSGELIGHPAIFRLVASMVGEKPSHYVDFEFSNGYFLDHEGQERMKFILRLIEINPEIDTNSQNKLGIYSFSIFSKKDNKDLGINDDFEVEDDIFL